MFFVINTFDFRRSLSLVDGRGWKAVVTKGRSLSRRNDNITTLASGSFGERGTAWCYEGWLRGIRGTRVFEGGFTERHNIHKRSLCWRWQRRCGACSLSPPFFPTLSPFFFPTPPRQDAQSLPAIGRHYSKWRLRHIRSVLLAYQERRRAVPVLSMTREKSSRLSLLSHPLDIFLFIRCIINKIMISDQGTPTFYYFNKISNHIRHLEIPFPGQNFPDAAFKPLPFV